MTRWRNSRVGMNEFSFIGKMSAKKQMDQYTAENQVSDTIVNRKNGQLRSHTMASLLVDVYSIDSSFNVC